MSSLMCLLIIFHLDTFWLWAKKKILNQRTYFTISWTLLRAISTTCTLFSDFFFSLYFSIKKNSLQSNHDFSRKNCLNKESMKNKSCIVNQILNFSCWFSPPISRSFLEIKEYIRMYRVDEQELFLDKFKSSFLYTP